MLASPAISAAPFTRCPRPLQDGRTPLMAAACAGNVRIFTTLLDAGCDLNAEDVGERNAFLWAAAEGHLDVVRAVIALDDTQVFAATKVRVGCVVL